MNYLAHLFLSRHHPEAVPGNYLADMMNPEELKKWPEELGGGVLLHRRIDVFTDRHVANKDMKNLLRPYFHKYAGVALDLYYDYILYQVWDQYSDMDFRTFADGQYAVIRGFSTVVPDRLQNTVEKMISGDFLHRYTTIEGQKFAFESLSRRARFFTGFEQALFILDRHQTDLTQHFHLFFPDMMEEVKQFLGGGEVSFPADFAD